MQEAKVQGGRHVAEAEDSGKSAKWNVSLQACVMGTGGGKSAGVGVGVRRHIGLHKLASFEIA